MKRFALVLAILAIAACDNKRGMETRTYEITRLTKAEVDALLTPYIGDGGYLDAEARLVSVRERPERLKLIEELLKKYDGGGEAADIVMNIQVIEANGFTERDSAIADVEGTLREMFKYRGYKLLGETRVQAREDGTFRNTNEKFQISGALQRIRTDGTEQRLPLRIELQVPSRASLESTVTAVIGKPLVLGQSMGDGAIILVVRASSAGK